MINTFIFDFDGLIVDTELIAYQIWSEIYHTHHVDLPLEEWVVCVGTSDEAFNPTQYLSRITGQALDENKLNQYYAQIYRARTDELPLKPGIQDYMDWAKENNFHLAIASSSNYEWVYSHLTRLKIAHYFDVIKTNRDVKEVKPAPDLFLAVKEFLHINDFEAVIFEDSLHGIQAGLLSNLYTVAVPNEVTKNMDFSAAHFTIPSLDATSPLKLLKTLEIRHKDHA
jgi:putative hydrolase of the HAD superfamily